jgi:hypothetical protein
MTTQKSLSPELQTTRILELGEAIFNRFGLILTAPTVTLRISPLRVRRLGPTIGSLKNSIRAPTHSLCGRQTATSVSTWLALAMLKHGH